MGDAASTTRVLTGFRLPMPRILCLCLAFAASIALLSSPAGAETFPRRGYEGAPNGQSQPFAGRWGMKFPEPEGTIVAATLVSCDDPIRIEAVDDSHIRYLSPRGGPAAIFEVFEFDGRTTWLPDGADSYITVWLDADSFHLHTTALGIADWDDPRVMFRCPD
jgi:hypothetical protein